MAGFAICHLRPSLGAGGLTCYVKFAAIGHPAAYGAGLRPAPAVARTRWAKAGADSVVALNIARQRLYEAMLRIGCRTSTNGPSMHRPNDAGYLARDLRAQ